jgi:hypothetical protein
MEQRPTTNNDTPFTAADVIRFLHEVTHNAGCDYQCSYDVQVSYRPSCDMVMYFAHIDARRLSLDGYDIGSAFDMFVVIGEGRGIAQASYRPHKPNETGYITPEYLNVLTFEGLRAFVAKKLGIREGAAEEGGGTEK